MYSVIPAFLLPILAIASPVAQTDSGPDQNSFTIPDTSYSGNGCPGGSVSTISDYDEAYVTFSFNSFQTYIGPGTAPTEKSKNCQLRLNVEYAGDFSFAVVAATYHGWARMDQGVSGSFVSSYYFSQNPSKTSTTRISISGGGALQTGQVFTQLDMVEAAAVVWSPCGTGSNLIINNNLALTSTDPSASGEFTNDDATVALTQRLRIAWTKCTPN